MTLLSRIPRMLDMDREDLPLLQRNAADPIKDRAGLSTVAVMGALRFIGIAEYIVSSDVDSFRGNLGESAKLFLSLVLRSGRGEPISDSYAHSILAYKQVLDALAAADFPTADALAKHTGLRPDWELAHDHPFDRAFGHALKAIVLNTKDEVSRRVAELEAMCRKSKNADFAGFATLYRGILDANLAQAQGALVAIAKGHKNQTERVGIFHGIVDEVISVWGVGVANLARWRGLPVTGIDPFIPCNLLLDESTTSTN